MSAGMSVIGLGEEDAVVQKPAETPAEKGTKPIQLIAAGLVDDQQQDQAWRRSGW